MKEKWNILRELVHAVKVIANFIINRIYGTPSRNDVAQTKHEYRKCVCPFWTLGTVSQGTDEDEENNTNVKVEKYFKDSFPCAVTEEIERVRVSIGRGRRNKLGDINNWAAAGGTIVTYKEESQIIISQRSPCEHKLDCIVDELELKNRVWDWKMKD